MEENKPYWEGKHFSFYTNKECEYYPCHKVPEGQDFNCLFCYCPLYAMEHCPGRHEYIDVNGRRVKSCMDCTFPHQPENYDKIMKILGGK